MLFLPWHEYFPTPFTDQRAIANPAAFYFAGTVITSQNPGVGYAFAAEDPEHVFIDKLLGPPVDPQRLRVALADLGVRFVALAKVADWRDFAGVEDAPGIRLVYSSPSLDLFSVRPTARKRATTAGCAPLTSSTTGSFPAVQALSRSPFPTRKAGHSTAIRRYGSPTGKRVSSRQQEEASFISARPAAFWLVRSDRSRPFLLSQASRSSSGEGGHSACSARTVAADGRLACALLDPGSLTGGCHGAVGKGLQEPASDGRDLLASGSVAERARDRAEPGPQRGVGD